MTARLLLVCHAPTRATREVRFPLPEDAAEAASPAAAPGWGRILSAPEGRARETAAMMGPAPEVDPALRDQDFGRWGGRALADLAAAEPEGLAAWASDPGSVPHGGESVAALVGRVEAWMAMRAAGGGRVLAVTHPAVLRAAVAAALGAGLASFWRIEAPPLARAQLSHDGRRWTLVALVPP